MDAGQEKKLQCCYKRVLTLGSDIVWTRNKMGYSKYPLVHGHEIVGIVKEVGSNVHGFKTGDHIGVGTYVNSCRDCEYCNDGVEVYCLNVSVFTFHGIDADDTITKGGYSSTIVVHRRYCYKISEDSLLGSAAPLLCGHCYTSTVRNDGSTC